MTLLNELYLHFSKNLPFVVYSKPDSEDLIVFFQDDISLYSSENLSEKGFVFTNFENNFSIVFDKTKCRIKKENIQDLSIDFPEEKSYEISLDAKSNHENLVNKTIQEIKRGTFEKAVISRTEKILTQTEKELIFFKRLLKAYPKAFVYWWFHPKVGQWMGATPEQLIKTNYNKLFTAALAGTQLHQGQSEIIWQRKEQNEQQIVTDYIVKSLNKNTENIEISQPFTVMAGKLAHIKTTISANFKAKDFSQIINNLHPTPALCGYPKSESKKFIIENEGYNRAFYGGYLGELNFDFDKNKDNHSDLFVNLRCMQVFKNHVNLFIGGGITLESNAEKEFLETVNKSSTLKKVLE